MHAIHTTGKQQCYRECKLTNTHSSDSTHSVTTGPEYAYLQVVFFPGTLEKF